MVDKHFDPVWSLSFHLLVGVQTARVSIILLKKHEASIFYFISLLVSDFLTPWHYVSSCNFYTPFFKCVKLWSVWVNFYVLRFAMRSFLPHFTSTFTFNNCVYLWDRFWLFFENYSGTGGHFSLLVCIMTFFCRH